MLQELTASKGGGQPSVESHALFLEKRKLYRHQSLHMAVAAGSPHLSVLRLPDCGWSLHRIIFTSVNHKIYRIEVLMVGESLCLRRHLLISQDIFVTTGYGWGVTQAWSAGAEEDPVQHTQCTRWFSEEFPSPTSTMLRFRVTIPNAFGVPKSFKMYSQAATDC